jgi:glycosyltransferase involved in cell wall biosynthesis
MAVHVVDPRGRGSALLWPWFLAGAVVRVLMLRARGQAQVMHLQVSERSSFIRKGLMLFIGRGVGMRVVLHHHGAELIPFYRAAAGPMRRWVRLVVCRADANIVLGERWRSFLVDEVGLRRDRVVVLHNAVPDHRTRQGGAGPVAGAEVRFLLLAHLSPRKGISEFLAAFQRLRQQGLAVRATLAGNGDIGRYRGEAEALGIAAYCSFPGWVDRGAVDRLLQSADALVLPSFEEGLPMAILEALSAARPVIATPVGSIGEVLADGENGLLVPPGDVAALAAAMARVAEDPTLRRALAQNGRALFEARFTIEAFMTRLSAIYRGESIAR